MPSTTLTIDQIVQSPFNVRKNEDAYRRTHALEASILAKGLIEPIIVHVLDDGGFGALAGGRRRRSIANLVARGDLPTDWPVPVVVLEDLPEAELIEISLAENFQRMDLEEYEVYAAVVDLLEAGHDVATIADRQGQTELWVRQALRLGRLAEPVFNALRARRIDIDQARAFGATEDRDLQAACFAAFEPSLVRPELVKAETIRRWYRFEDREAEKLLRFVGADAYAAAGGWYEGDLFDDRADGRGRVADDTLLRRLADAKVGELRDAARTRVGRPDLRFQPEPPRNPEFGGHDSMLYVQPGGPDENQLPDGDIVAVIRIDDDGAAEVSFWWASRKALAATKPKSVAKPISSAPGAAIGASPGNVERRTADAAIREETGITAEGTVIMRSLRRAILRAALVQDAREGRHLGRDYLTWAQLRMQLSTAGRFGNPEGPREVGMRGLSAGEPGVDGTAVAHIEATEAHATWCKAIAELRAEPFIKAENLEAALSDFQAAPQKTRDLAAAVVAALALEPSLEAELYQIPVHDTLAARAHVAHPQAIRHWWAPTADFLELMPTAERLAIVEPFVGPETFASWGRKKSDELTPLVLRVVEGTAPSTKRAQQIAAAQWVHPLLMFRRTAGASAGDQAGAAE